MNRNFAMTPHHFSQVPFIQVPLGETAVLTAYVFVQWKTQSVYEELHQANLDSCAALGLFPDPEKTTTD